MRHLKLIAAALALLALSACVGFIVPIPLPASAETHDTASHDTASHDTDTHDTDRNERR